MHPRTTRRRWLASCAGTASVGTLAGCLGSDETTDEGSKTDGESGESGDSADGSPLERLSDDSEWPMKEFDAGNSRSTAQWSGPSGPVERLWTADVDGRTTTIPVVAGGTVYVGTGNRSYYALDARTGDVEWDYSAESVESRCAPAVGDAVYVGDENVQALDPDTGDVRWEADTELSRVDEVRVHDDTVYAIGGSHAVALEADSGEVRWSVEADDFFKDVAVGDDGTAYLRDAPSENGRLLAVDGDSGEITWDYQYERETYISDVRAAHGFVYTADDTEIVKLDGETGERDTDVDIDAHKIPTIGEEALYTVPFDSGHEIAAFDRQSGDRRDRTDDKEMRIFTDPVLAGDTIFVAGGGAFIETVAAFDADTGAERWQHDVSDFDSVFGTSVVEGLLYFSTADYVVALG